MDAEMDRPMAALGNTKEKAGAKAKTMTAAEEAVLSLLSPQEPSTYQGQLENRVHYTYLIIFHVIN